MVGIRGGRTSTRRGALRLAVALAAVAALVLAPLAGSTTLLFHTHADYATLTTPASPALADLNGDGYPDIVVAGQQSLEGVSVLINNGDGTYATHVDYAAPAGVQSNGQANGVAIGDLNGDGHPDIAFDYGNGATGTVGILINNGDGTFATAVGYGVGASPEGIAIGNFNADSNPDIAVAAEAANSVSILLGNGDGTFQTATSFGTRNSPFGLAVGDVNNDGHDDVVVHAFGDVSTLLGNGDGTFQAHADSIAGQANSVQLADMNGDGKLDALGLNVGSALVMIGKGDGTFNSPQSYSASNSDWDIATGDLNGDGKVDVVVTNLANVGNVSVLLGNGDGTLGTHTEYAVGSYPNSSAIGDVDLDGHPDIIVANGNSNSVSTLIQQLSSDANLSNLNLSAGLISPTFDPATTSYSDVVKNSQSSLIVVPTAEDSTASIQVRVNGGAYSSVASGADSNPLSLSVGDNTVDVLVTAQDGSTQTYSIDVTRLQPFECEPTPTYPCWTQFTVDGGDPPAGLQLQTFSSNGSVIVQLQKSSDYELASALDGNSAVHAEILLGTYDPVVFATTGFVSSYHETTGAGTNYIDLDVSPSSSSWSTSCQIGNCGTDQSPLTATHDYSDMVLGFVNDLSALGSTAQDQMRGSWIATNAQSFSLPTYNASLGTFSFQVASPHFKSDGSTVNTGFFQAFMPDALVESMGVSDPSSMSKSDLQVINSNGGSVGFDFTHNDDPAGVEIQTNAPFDYSSPRFTISQAVDHFAVSTDAGVNAGGPLAVQVQALDSLGDVVHDYTGTVHFTGGGANAILPPDYTFTGGDAGTHTFSGVVLKEAGEQTITATDTATSSLTGTTDTIDVSPGAAFKLAVSPVEPLPVRGGADLSATVEDAYGNVESSDNSTVVSFAQAFGDGSVSGLRDATASAGVASESITGTASGTVVLQVSASGLIGTPAEFDVLSKDGSGTIAASPTTVKHGTSTLVTLTYRAAAGGMSDGALQITVPAGWTAPTSNPSRPGYPVATVGAVTVHNRTISVTDIRRHAGQKLTVVFDRKGTVTAPATAVGAQAWTVTERSSGGGTFRSIAKSPAITVK